MFAFEGAVRTFPKQSDKKAQKLDLQHLSNKVDQFDTKSVLVLFLKNNYNTKVDNG